MKKSFFASSFIVLLTIFFRFYNFSSLFYWSMDEEYWAYMARNIALGEHLPLIGGNIGGTGWHTTPWLVYIFGALSYLGKGNPLALGVFCALLGVATTYLIYSLGRKIFGKKRALVAAFIYGISASASFADRRFWNPSVIPILTLIIFYSLWGTGSRKKITDYILLAVSLSLFFASHGMALIFFLVSTIYLFLQRTKLNYRYLIVAGLVFLFSLSPIVIFEFKHDFVQTRRFFAKEKPIFNIERVRESASLFIVTSSRFFYYPDDFDAYQNQAFGCNLFPVVRKASPLGIFLALISLTYLVFRIKKKENEFIIIGLFLSAFTIGLFIWPEGLRAYYLYPLFIFLPFLFASLLLDISKRNIYKPIVFLFLIVIFYMNLQKIIYSYNSDSYEKKLVLVEDIVFVAQNKAFSFDLKSADPCKAYGYRYIFSYKNSEPVKSYMDPYFLWLYETRLPKVAPQKNFLVDLKDENQEISISYPSQNGKKR